MTEYLNLLKIEIFCEATKNEAKQQMSGFLAMLLNTLRDRLLENILAGKVWFVEVKEQLKHVKMFDSTPSF